MEWNGRNGIMLAEYLDDKQRLAEKRIKLVATPANGREKLQEEIKEIEEKIIIFLSGLDADHLRDILYMSLDIERD